MAVNIVLVEPEIPQNTGNIARSCSVTGCSLHLVKPLGFSVDNKYLKRAGLDYWNDLDIKYYDSLEELFNMNPDSTFFFATTKGKKRYCDVEYRDNCFIIFGKETAGLPEKVLYDNYDSCIRLPMKHDKRSLNLSNAVAIIMYEALRQIDFPGLEDEGKLRDYSV